MGLESESGEVTIPVEESTGEIKIANDVVATIAVSVQISLIIEYGCSVPVVTAKVQERVKSAIENMTGLEVTEVKITVAGVNM